VIEHPERINAGVKLINPGIRSNKSFEILVEV